MTSMHNNTATDTLFFMKNDDDAKIFYLAKIFNKVILHFL